MKEELTLLLQIKRAAEDLLHDLEEAEQERYLARVLAGRLKEYEEYVNL